MNITARILTWLTFILIMWSAWTITGCTPRNIRKGGRRAAKGTGVVKFTEEELEYLLDYERASVEVEATFERKDQ